MINAALSRSVMKSIENSDPEFLAEYFRKNLIPNFDIIRHSIKYLENFRIILFSSIAVTGMENNSFYGVCKAGIESLVRSAALEMKDTGSRIFCLRLGPVDIDKSGFAGNIRIQHDTLQESLIKRCIGNSKLSMQEISGFIKFLLDNEKSYFHSEIIPLSAGYGLL